ncbi:MAG: formyltransferase family protein [Pseudomonadota bacterium]|nr:formyltransferase family protein [Pseudomonadota bacterium]
MKRTVILTGSELRHRFVRKLISASPGINVVRSYCEGTEKALKTLALGKGEEAADLELEHLRARDQSEEDFFSHLVRLIDDRSNPISLPKGGVNSANVYKNLCDLDPDLLISYGCSIVKDPLLSRFTPGFVNVHLGLSPYYRGAGTNFWPFVNGELEYVGITFMHIDAGIDTGEIIHQMRPRIVPGDDIHSIGNRLIGDMARMYAEIIRKFDDLHPMPQLPVPPDEKVYRRADFTNDSVVRLYLQTRSGLVDRYLQEREERCARVPIIVNPALASAPGEGGP